MNFSAEADLPERKSLALNAEEKEYVITEAVNILRDQNRMDLVKMLGERLEQEETATAISEGGLDKRKLDSIVWAVTKALLNRETGQRKREEG